MAHHFYNQALHMTHETVPSTNEVGLWVEHLPNVAIDGIPWNPNKFTEEVNKVDVRRGVDPSPFETDAILALS